MLLVIVNLLIDVVLSTAHKAKGLEFDTVRLTDDYLSSDTGILIIVTRMIKSEPWFY